MDFGRSYHLLLLVSDIPSKLNINPCRIWIYEVVAGGFAQPVQRLEDFMELLRPD
jgi:hypothetical protein